MAEYTCTSETQRTPDARVDFFLCCMKRVFRPLSSVAEIGEYSYTSLEGYADGKRLKQRPTKQSEGDREGFVSRFVDTHMTRCQGKLQTFWHGSNSLPLVR